MPQLRDKHDPTAPQSIFFKLPKLRVTNNNTRTPPPSLDYTLSQSRVTTPSLCLTRLPPSSGQASHACCCQLPFCCTHVDGSWQALLIELCESPPAYVCLPSSLRQPSRPFRNIRNFGTQTHPAPLPPHPNPSPRIDALAVFSVF